MCKYIKPRNFILSFFIFFPINFTIVFYATIYYHYEIPQDFIYYLLSVIIIDLNFLYLFICLICDISFCCSKKLKPLNNFMRNKLCHILTPLSYFQTIVVGFDTYYKRTNIYREEEIRFFCAFFSSIILIINILLFDHKIHKYSSQEISIISISLVICEIIYIIANPHFNYRYPPFKFLENIHFWSYIRYCFLSLIICIPCYLFNIYLIYYKYKIFLKKENGNDDNDNNEDNNEIIERNLIF